MKSVPARAHLWRDSAGNEVAEHRKSNDGRWSYRHKLSAREFEAGKCSEHGKVHAGSRWCPHKPAAMDDLLWNMPALLAAIGKGSDVLWCAGEKDAERVQKVLDEAGSDAIATCVHQGENSPVTDGQVKIFASYQGRVIIYFDHDATGLRHAADRRKRLDSIGVRSRFRGWAPEGALASGARGVNDISDYLDGNNRLSDMRTIPWREVRAAARASAAEASAARQGTKRLAPPSGRAPAAAGLLEAFRAALKKAGCRQQGDKWSCPHPDHDDANPSFGVSERPGKGLVLACSCPRGMSSGADHTEWAGEILEALGLGWDALTGRVAESAADEEFPRNDTGNAALLRELHGPDILHVRGTDRLLAWDGRRWSEEEDKIHAMLLDVVARRFEMARECKDPKAASLLRAFAVSCGNGSRLREMERAARYIGRSVPETAIDSARHLLPAANGTVELGDRGCELREHRRDDHFTRQVPVAWEPEARSAAWDEFLDRFVPDPDNRAWLQAIMGYCLLGWNKDRLVLVLKGVTSTGKTTFINLIMDALGQGFAGTFQLSMFRTRRDDAPRPDILKSMPRRIIAAEEASSEWKLHADTIKGLTSGGRIEARGMRSNTFEERTPAFVPIIAANAYPIVQFADMATKRRLFAFPFSQQIREGDEDSSFRARIGRKDREAIFAWLCAGYDMYVRHPGFEFMPPGVMETTGELRMSLNPIDQFLSEKCETGSSYRSVPAALYESFCAWWEEDGQKPSERPTQTAFGRHLTDAGYPQTSPAWDKKIRKNTRYRTGIRTIS